MRRAESKLTNRASARPKRGRRETQHQTKQILLRGMKVVDAKSGTIGSSLLHPGILSCVTLRKAGRQKKKKNAAQGVSYITENRPKKKTGAAESNRGSGARRMIGRSLTGRGRGRTGSEMSRQTTRHQREKVKTGPLWQHNKNGGSLFSRD